MVLMALDHVRDFFSNAQTFDPVDLTHTTPTLFLTRWITHFCAPIFVFLAGTGAMLSLSHGKATPDLARFLLSRGLWLVFLDLFVVHTFGWWFNVDYHLLYGDVLWALGWSMVAMAGLVFLPTWSVAGVGLVLITFHNLFDVVRADNLGSARWLWAILHSGDMLEPLPGVHFIPGYPLLPWIGVMAAGYACGTLLLRSHNERRLWFLRLGAGLSVAFVAIRATNLYGDPRGWATQSTWVFTILSFINCEKYPPSLLYLLMTLGPALIALALFEGIANPLDRFLVTLGRVPLFYYLLHLAFIHALAVAFAYAEYGRADWMFRNPPLPITSSVLQFPKNYGYGLATVYAIWLGVVVSLYPLCRWYAGIKGRRRRFWLSYL